MTNFKFQSYIPKQDIKVRPSAIVKELYNLLDMEIEDNSFEDITSKNNLRYINKLYKKMKELLVNYHFWYNVSSYNFCCYQFRNPKNKNDIGKICGRRINIKNSYDSNSNKFLCSEHDRNHRKNHSKPIKLKENEILCTHINKDGTNCKYSSKINELCTKHYKHIYKIDKNEIYNKIIFYKDYTNINSEIKLFNNIDFYNTVDNLKNVINIDDKITFLENNIQENINQPTMELLEIAPNNLNNSNSSNKFAKIKKIIKNCKNLENLNIDSNNDNIHSKIKQLNNKLIKNKENNKSTYKNYAEIIFKKYEAKGFINCKDYNIIYNIYCKEHITDRPKPLIQKFFHVHLHQ